MTKRFGFTLAEVLITLTIIGVIAAMTIPTLMSNTADQEYKTGLKKAVSTLNQAITMQYALDGTTPGDLTTNATEVITDLFQKRMQVISTTSERATAVSQGNATNAAVYLSDGMVIEIPVVNTAASLSEAGSGNSTSCNDNKWSADNNGGCLYTIVVDVNGDKGKCNVATGVAADKNTDKVRPKDCYPIDIYEEGARPANWVGREIMYNGL